MGLNTNKPMAQKTKKFNIFPVFNISRKEKVRIAKELRALPDNQLANMFLAAGQAMAQNQMMAAFMAGMSAGHQIEVPITPTPNKKSKTSIEKKENDRGIYQ
jgi:hypothetical protein